MGSFLGFLFGKHEALGGKAAVPPVPPRALKVVPAAAAAKRAPAPPRTPAVPKVGIAVSRDVIAGVLGDLVHNGRIKLADAEAVQVEADQRGVLPYTILSERKLVSHGELYAAVARQPEALRKQIGLVVNSASELPEWSVVLNDAGGKLGGAERVRGVIAVAIAEELAAAARDHKAPQCFILVTEEGRKSPGYSELVSRIIAAGYVTRATLLLAEPGIAEIVWSQWDETHGAAASTLTGGISEVHKLFDEIGHEAYAKNASDIHIIAKGGVGQILYRVDGDVLPQRYITGDDAIKLCAAIYDTLTDKSSVSEEFSVKSQQNGSVDRPYDDIGQVRFRYAGSPVEPGGYRVAMRVIPVGTHQRPKTLAQLGYAESHQLVLNRAFLRSSGLILFSGTTGSGKSTTMSNRIRILVQERPTKVVLTVEEPVEYIIDGAHQTAVLRKDGENGQNAFQRTLSNIMRQDPDILMLGEIRDIQTADMALQGVRSGHLLISTIHAGAAPTCYDRMAGLGVPRPDLATMDLVAALVFQALVQVLCTHCRIPVRDMLSNKDPAISGTVQRLRIALEKGVVPGSSKTGDGLDGIFLRNPSGCEHCRNRGIVGRTVCAEVFQPTPDMLTPIAKGDSTTLWRMWREQVDPKDPSNMRGRRAIEHAMWKMTQGLVSPVEVESSFRGLDESIFGDAD